MQLTFNQNAGPPKQLIKIAFLTELPNQIHLLSTHLNISLMLIYFCLHLIVALMEQLVTFLMFYSFPLHTFQTLINFVVSKREIDCPILQRMIQVFLYRGASLFGYLNIETQKTISFKLSIIDGENVLPSMRIVNYVSNYIFPCIT